MNITSTAPAVVVGTACVAGAPGALAAPTG
jgi:hypothetical protein